MLLEAKEKIVAVGIPKKPRNNSQSLVLEYAGKKSSEAILKDKKKIDFELIKQNDQVNPNSLYWGDNLDILKHLINDENVAGKVKLIYIDPPYATKTVFQNRKLQHAYEDILDGADYIEFLRERLILMHRLLSEDGSLYLHLDEKMIFEAKLIMDEIFGKNNFRNLITRKKSNPKNFTKKQYGNVSDYILFYSKSDKMKFNIQYTPWTEETSLKEYQYVEENTGRRYKKVPIHAPGIRNGETGKEWKGMLPPPGKHWQYTPEKLTALDEAGEIYWSPNGNPRRKVYLDQQKGISAQDIWLDYKDAHNQNIKITGYPTEKNLDLLLRIVSASSDKGDLVLDAFAGSGTTLEAATRLERRWIGIDNSELAINTIVERFEKGTSKMGTFAQTKNNSTQEFNYIYDISYSPFEILKVK